VIPHQLWLNHPEFITDCTNIDYLKKPADASMRFHEIWDVDNGGPIHLVNSPLKLPSSEKRSDGGKITDEGFNTVWYNKSPFINPEDLWNFDPDPFGKDAEKAVEPNYAVRNFRWCFELETWEHRLNEENRRWEEVEKKFPDKFTEARSFYCTSFMWAICIFGWDVFLMALGLDPDKTGQAIQRISMITEKMYKYFATCNGAKFVAAHDDLCINSGTVASPEWYKKYIFPEYERIFKPVKDAGKSVILISDGNISTLAPELAEIVDGFIFESSTPSDFMFKRFGKDKCLIGGIDVRPLTFGNENDVRKEVKSAIERGKDCPGYVIACSDTIPANVPLKNVYAYFETVEKFRKR